MSGEIMICQHYKECNDSAGCRHCVPHIMDSCTGVCTGANAVCLGRPSVCRPATVEEIVLYRLEGGVLLRASLTL